MFEVQLRFRISPTISETVWLDSEGGHHTTRSGAHHFTTKELIKLLGEFDHIDSTLFKIIITRLK